MASAESLKILRALQSKPENKVRLRKSCCPLPRGARLLLRILWAYIHELLL